MIVRPSSLTEVVDIVRSCTQVIPQGGSTKQALSAVQDNNSIVHVDMRSICGIVSYDPSEFLITANAGTSVDEISHELAKHGQYLPFDPLWSSQGATLGGTVASGLSGPSRVLYGAIRDFIVEVALVDGLGREVRGGGKVVKNAAGFDFPKMMVGSYGRMGILTEITLKVFPRPQATLTLLWEAPNLAACVQAAMRILGQPLQIAAIEIEPPDSMIVRIAGPQEALSQMADRVDTIIGVKTARIANPATEQRMWNDRTELGWVDDGHAIAKVATTIGQVESVLNSVKDLECVRGAISSCAGAVVWLAIDMTCDLEPIDSLLRELKLSGVFVSGPVNQLTMLGERNWVHFASRIQRAIDPQHKFVSFAN